MTCVCEMTADMQTRQFSDGSRLGADCANSVQPTSGEPSEKFMNVQPANAARPGADAPTAAPPIRRVNLLGMSIDAVTQQQAVEKIIASYKSGIGGWVITPNLDHLRQF